MPPCENEADNKSLESQKKLDSSSKQEQDETITDKNKAQLAIFQSLRESGAATIFLFLPGMS